jgi:hypothetical protein
MTPAAQEIAQYEANMAVIDVGATLRHKKTIWVVTRYICHARREGHVALTLVSGKKTIKLNVPICHTGPVLADLDLTPVALAPVQCAFFTDGGAA